MLLVQQNRPPGGFTRKNRHIWSMIWGADGEKALR